MLKYNPDYELDSTGMFYQHKQQDKKSVCMEIDMEDYHCGHCGRYVSEADGFYGAAERADGEPQKIYCDNVCCKKAEPDIVL